MSSSTLCMLGKVICWTMLGCTYSTYNLNLSLHLILYISLNEKILFFKTDECKVPEIPVNVVILPRLGKGSQVRVGQKLTFSCRVRGHYIQGNEEVECLANGQWSGHFPTCGRKLIIPGGLILFLVLSFSSFVKMLYNSKIHNSACKTQCET